MKSDKFGQTISSGVYGNLYCEPAAATFAGEAAGEVLDVIEFGAGTTIESLRFNSEGLGVGVTVAYGYVLDDGTTDADAFLAATAAAVDGDSGSSDFAPIYFEQGGKVIGTTAGGASTGKITTTVNYIYRNR